MYRQTANETGQKIHKSSQVLMAIYMIKMALQIRQIFKITHVGITSSHMIVIHVKI